MRKNPAGPLLAAALAGALALVPGPAAAHVGVAESSSAGLVAMPVGGPTGWATAGAGTTGGAGAAPESVHVVETRAELVEALANHGDPTAPKLVLVRGDIAGNEADDGRLLDAADYAPGWDLERYMACFGPEGTEWSDARHPWCGEQRRLRTTGSNAQKRQIQLTVPSNTTVLGLGRDARLLGVNLTINTGRNIIVRDLEFEAPVDHFPSWDPWDGEDGAWNARFDAFSVVTGTNVWIDHCTFGDGRYPNGEAPTGFHGEPVERHDGLLDMEDGTDYVTVSYSRFTDHSKTLLIGSGDGRGDRDRGRLRMTFHHNLFADSAQRSPRVRFGQVHAYNNYFTGATDDPDYPMRYGIGVGLESAIVSEYNAFDYTGPGASAELALANLNGHRFLDRGSWFRGRPTDLNAVAARQFEERAAEARALPEPPEWALREFTTDVGWRPADVYDYRPQRDPRAVRATVLALAGAGRPAVPWS
ncbi:polysaccharide lyase family 1 protein [Streptomyces mayteni]